MLENGRMRRWIAVLSLCISGCGGERSEVAETTQNPDTGYRDVVTEQWLDSPTVPIPKPPIPSALQTAAWLAVADSVMRVHLERSLFLSPDGYAHNMDECSDDQGGDNPPTAIAASRARIIDRDSVRAEWAWDYQ